MAIGQPAISAADVQRAYTQDFSGVGNLMQNLQQQQYRRQLIEEQRRQQQARQQAALMEENMSPLMKATGTPFDQYASKRSQEILKGYTDFMRQNPNAPLPAQQQYFLENTGALKSEIETAQILQKQIDAYASTIAKEYPALDQTKIMEGLRKAAWYDEKGGIKTPDVNAIAGFVTNLNSPDNYRKYVNPEALPSTIIKTLDERYPAQGKVIPVKDSPYYWDTKLRDYESFDPATGERFIPSETYKVGETELPLMPAALYKSLASDRNFMSATLNQLDDIYEAAPQAKKLPQDVVQRLAANMVMEQLGQRMSKEPPIKKVSEEAKWTLQLQRDARNEARAQRGEARSEERLRLYEQGKKEQKQAVEQYAQFFSSAMSGDQATLSQTKKTYVPGIGEAYDITAAMPGDGFLEAKDGTKRVVKYLHDGKNAYRINYQKDAMGNTVPLGYEKLSESQRENAIKTATPDLRTKVAQYQMQTPAEVRDEAQAAPAAQPAKPVFEIQIGPQDLEKIFE